MREKRMGRGLLLVVSGPSGVGKGTVLGKLMEENENIFYSVSATTRTPREGETEGVNYFFITKEQFERLIVEDKMLEYARYCDNYYGTPLAAVEQMREEGKDVLLEIEAQGALQVMNKCPDAVSIFVAPPSMDELRRRLTERNTESAEVVESRLRKAEEEMALAHHYQYNVVNDTVENAKDKISKIIFKHKSI